MNVFKADIYFKEVYVLALNPMMGSTEGVATFEFNTREELKAAYDEALVEPYQDVGPDSYSDNEKTYTKSFRKGSPFEWMNPLSEHELQMPGMFGHGIYVRRIHLAGPLNITPHHGPIPV